MLAETSSGSASFSGTIQRPDERPRSGLRMSQLVTGFRQYARFELSLAPETVEKYASEMKAVIGILGDLPVEEITARHVTEIKEQILARGVGAARLSSLIYGLKAFIRYCRDGLDLSVLELPRIKAPKRPRRDVVFLSSEEVEQFVSSIRIERAWDGKQYAPGVRLDGLRFRALVEVLLGTGMRISEALSLNRDSIDLARGEATIIGKGNKERVVFFTERALLWIDRYLEARSDSAIPLFITQQGTRLSRADISGLFARYARRAGLDKKVTPHILRHTAATTLLFNGCPIAHVKEILGHERLETTCKYYLGVDRKKAKAAHQTFLTYRDS